MRMLAMIAPFVLALSSAAAEPKAEKPASTCKPTVVGRGLERKVVCVFEEEVVVKTSTPKPQVMYITKGGKAVTGRPRSDDRLNGLSRRLR
ncbi:MAG: hypothetical protein SFX73_35730 [Kofleriaceae bacterium]|nr:hypothetical protein [Kofleriaceae bacterium]